MASSFSVVIPSLNGNVDALLGSMAGQTAEPDQVEVVTGVGPSGRARNQGVARTRSPVLAFIDDDAVLGAPDTLANLIAPLEDPAVGAVGASKLIPAASSRFERAVARQVPRIEHAVVAHLTDSNPPADRFGYTDVTTTCCALRRDVLERCGGFDEHLDRGVDSELFYRVRKAGYRLVMAPGTWVHHPAPAGLWRLLSKHLWYGIGYAQEVQRHPELATYPLRSPAHAAFYLVLRTVLLMPHAFFGYSRADPSWAPRYRPLGAAASYAAALGYVYGWYRRPYPPAASR